METNDILFREERNELRKKWNSGFLYELETLIAKCFLRPKEKKEHFITQEKIEIALLKLLQSQKKFQSPTSSRTDLRLLAIFYSAESQIGKIKTLHLDRKEVEFLDMFSSTQIRPLSEVIVFDVYSPELEIYFEKQKKFYDSFSYKDVFAFLTGTNKEIEKKESVRITTISGLQQIKLDHMDYSK